jgi:hypothetical protein
MHEGKEGYILQFSLLDFFFHHVATNLYGVFALHFTGFLIY